MKQYCYIITRDGEGLHVGFCEDIIKTIAKYKAIPSMRIDRRKNCLVYLEEATDEIEARKRLDEITRMTKLEKLALIETTNPQYFELIPGKNITL